MNWPNVGKTDARSLMRCSARRERPRSWLGLPTYWEVSSDWTDLRWGTGTGV